ncbi:hypothetical protein ABK040_016142 [Willaertia magna]
MKYPTKRVSLVQQHNVRFQQHCKRFLKRHVNMYGKNNGDNNGDYTSDNNSDNSSDNNLTETITLAQQKEIEEVIKNVKSLIEKTSGKKCLGLTEEDVQYINQHIVGNENFKRMVKQNINNWQFYFFPKLDNIYIAIIHKQDNFAITYFSVLW